MVRSFFFSSLKLEYISVSEAYFCVIEQHLILVLIVEVQLTNLPHNKKDSDKTVHNLQLASA